MKEIAQFLYKNEYLKESKRNRILQQKTPFKLNFYNRIKVLMYKANLKQKRKNLNVKSLLNNLYF